MTTTSRPKGEIVNPHVLDHVPEPKPDFARMAQVLREHWLTGTGCDKDAGTNVATCFCSKWRSRVEYSPVAAVDRWIEHVMEHLK
jgi:hypothetical protein